MKQLWNEEVRKIFIQLHLLKKLNNDCFSFLSHNVRMDKSQLFTVSSRLALNAFQID